MNETHKYFEFNDQNFQTEVLAAKGVVMVDFFASWCGPCRMLSPIIEELAQTYKGKALIGKYSTEENRLYAQQFQVSSIPCVKFWKDGQYQGEIVGFRNAQTYSQVLDKLLSN